MSVQELLSSPATLAAIRDAVLQIQGDLAPAEVEVTVAYVDPLIELAARDRLPPADSADRPGAYGAAEWMLPSIISLVVGVLQARLTASEAGEVPGPITEEEVRAWVRRSGSQRARKLIPELTRSLRRAFHKHISLALGSAAETATREERHTDIACPRQVWKGTARFSLVVRLTVGPAPLSVAESSLFVAPGKAVHIHLEAPAAIEILSSAWQEIAISPDQDSPPAVFDLRPREVGAQSLVLDFYQAGNPLGTVRLSVDVLDQPLPEAQVRTRPHVLSLDARVPPPDRVLRIASHPESSSLVLTLIQGGGTSWSNPSSWQFRRDPALWAEELFKELNALIGHSDRPSRDVWIARGSPPAADVEKELKRIGQNLWQGLPEEFRSLYARERKLWKDSSLLILTDEPHLPWELLWPYDEVDDDEPWCLTLCLSRWLARRAVGDGNTGAPGILPLTALACVAPEDSHLPAARRERIFLQSLLRNRGVRDISPSVATLDAILDLLRVGPFDWFHVISHGNFSPRDPDRRSALCLEGRQALTPQHLVGAEIEGVLRRSHPAFVFNACHAGRMGWELTGLGGWADRLISCGAGLFLGPLWKVTDKAALQMARSFYERLLAGDTVAEAARKARREARKLGDPSWLAYSLYAHPNATVRLPGEARQVHTTLAASPPAS